MPYICFIIGDVPDKLNVELHSQFYVSDKRVDPAVARNCTTLIQNSQKTGFTYGESELAVGVQYAQYLLPNIATKIALRNLETEN